MMLASDEGDSGNEMNIERTKKDDNNDNESSDEDGSDNKDDDQQDDDEGVSGHSSADDDSSFTVGENEDDESVLERNRKRRGASINQRKRARKESVSDEDHPDESKIPAQQRWYPSALDDNSIQAFSDPSRGRIDGLEAAVAAAGISSLQQQPRSLPGIDFPSRIDFPSPVSRDILQQHQQQQQLQQLRLQQIRLQQQLLLQQQQQSSLGTQLGTHMPHNDAFSLPDGIASLGNMNTLGLGNTYSALQQPQQQQLLNSLGLARRNLLSQQTHQQPTNPSLEAAIARARLDPRYLHSLLAVESTPPPSVVDPTTMALLRLQQQQQQLLRQQLPQQSYRGLTNTAPIPRGGASDLFHTSAFPQQEPPPRVVVPERNSVPATFLEPQPARLPIPDTRLSILPTTQPPQPLASITQDVMPPSAPLAPDGFPFQLPVILARPDDSNKLSQHQILLRNQIEVFQATEDDINTHTRGRNKPIALNQVGIRCRHCSDLPVAQRQKGSTYFPASLMGIYQAAQNMSTTHMQCGLCHKMPDKIKTLFAQLLETKGSTTGAGRLAWAQAGRKLGLIDTTEGIYFVRNIPLGVAPLLGDAGGGKHSL